MKGGIRTNRRNPQLQPVVKQTMAFSNLPLSVAGTTGVGFGTAVVGDFPEGNILLLGAVSYLVARTVDTDVLNNYTGSYAIGTVPNGDATLSGTDLNIIPATVMAAATAGVSPNTRGASTVGGQIFDNTDGSLELNLNLLIDDASISGTGDFTVSGTVHIAYIVLGDD